MIKHIALPFVLSLTISGCCGLSVTQQEATNRFASASSDLGAFAATELVALRKATIQMNTQDIAIGGTASIANLDEAFNVDDIAARINAAEALSSYGNLLLALVNESDTANLKNASLQFVDSVRGVSGKKLSDAQLDVLGKAVYSIGGLFIEQQKAKTVKRIVNESKDQVIQICDLFIHDFNPTGLGLLQGIDTSSKRLKVDADIAVASSDDMKDKLVAVEAFSLAQNQNQKAKMVGTKVTSTLNALKKANAELVNALNDDSVSLTDIKTVGTDMKNLGLALKVFGGQ